MCVGEQEINTCVCVCVCVCVCSVQGFLIHVWGWWGIKLILVCDGEGQGMNRYV